MACDSLITSLIPQLETKLWATVADADLPWISVEHEREALHAWVRACNSSLRFKSILDGRMQGTIKRKDIPSSVLSSASLRLADAIACAYLHEPTLLGVQILKTVSAQPKQRIHRDASAPRVVLQVVLSTDGSPLTTLIDPSPLAWKSRPESKEVIAERMQKLGTQFGVLDGYAHHARSATIGESGANRMFIVYVDARATSAAVDARNVGFTI